jgi:hypothetical protein
MYIVFRPTGRKTIYKMECTTLPAPLSLSKGRRIL